VSHYRPLGVDARGPWTRPLRGSARCTAHGARARFSRNGSAHGQLLIRDDTRRSEATALGQALDVAQELGLIASPAKIRACSTAVGGRTRWSGDAIFRRDGDVWTVALARRRCGPARRGPRHRDPAAHPAGRSTSPILSNVVGAMPTPAAVDVAEEVTHVASEARCAPDRRQDDCAPASPTAPRAEDAERCNGPRAARTELGFIAASWRRHSGPAGAPPAPLEGAEGVSRREPIQRQSHRARAPPLAAHLRRYVRTGTVCTYFVPDEPVRWIV
jgi:hypothetical protein